MLSVTHLLQTFGIAGLVAIVLAETALLLGVILPGDSLLFTAGLLASQQKLNLAAVMVGAALAAIIGDQIGYVIGQRVGPRLFARPDARVFKQAHLRRADAFFARHGPKTIVLARFVPLVRTFVPTLAGAARMNYRQFVTFNVAGGLLWGTGVPAAGYLLGKSVPSIDKYLLPVIGLIVVVSLVPVAFETLRHRRTQPS